MSATKEVLKERLELLAVAAGLPASLASSGGDKAQRLAEKARDRAIKGIALLFTRWQPQSAYSLAVRALSSGTRCPEALGLAACCRYFGWGVEKSEPAALLLGSLGAYLGNPHALALLASHTLSYVETPPPITTSAAPDPVAQQNALVVSALKDLFPTPESALSTLSDQAEDQANLLASYLYGMVLRNGHGGLTADARASLVPLRSASKAGFAMASFELGEVLVSLHELDQALEAYRLAEKAGYLPAMGKIAIVYGSNEYSGKDLTKQLEWNRKGAELGDPSCMRGLGWCYQKCLGMPSNDANRLKSTEWYRKAAEAGFGRAMNDLGFYYQKGLHGVEVDLPMAIYWYQAGANAGDSASMNNLAYCYRNAVGVEKNEALALKWTKRSVKIDNSANSWRTLGWCHQNGLGCEEDLQESFRCYSKAAELGNIQALNDLGWFYEKGLHVKADREKAIEYYERAVAKGHNIAKSNLARVRKA